MTASNEPDAAFDSGRAEYERVRLAARRALGFECSAPRRLKDRYEPLRPLGEGHWGRVWLARDHLLAREVAVKFVQVRDIDRTDPRDLFHEAMVLAQLQHPNIIDVYDVGEEEGEIFIVTPRIEGRTVEQWLADAPRRWRECLEVFVPAGRGLAAAHRGGVIHRDFKPANVMLDQAGNVRVLDFGLARRDEVSTSMSGSPDRSSETSTVGGTRGYMAPEQYDGRVDERSDQFSFCASLFRALYGRLPYAPDLGAPRAEALDRGPAASGAGVPSWLRHTVVRGLHPDPARRHADMESLLAALRPRSHRRWWAASAITAVVAAGLWGWWPSPPEPSCDDDDIATLWPAEHRARLLQIGSPLDLEVIDASMDAFVEGWSALYQQTCRARAAGALDEELDALRRECLGRARERVETVLARSGEPDFEHWRLLTGAIVDSVELSECRDDDRLRARRPDERIDPARSEALRVAMARANVHALLDEDSAYLAELLEIERSLADEDRAPAETLWLAIHIGGALADAGRFDEAESRLRQALQTAQRWHRWPEVEGGVMFALAEVLCRRPGGSAEARLLAEQAVAVLHASPLARDHLPHALQILALARLLEGDGAGALEAIDESLERAQGPAYPGQGPRTALRQRGASLHIRGQALEVLDRMPDAEHAYRDALAVCDELGGSSRLEASVLNNLGSVLRRMGRLEEAIQIQRRAVEVKVALGRLDLAAESLGNVGNVHASAGEPAAALVAYDEALALLATVDSGSRGPSAARLRLNRAYALQELGRGPEALDDFGRVLALAPADPELRYAAWIGRGFAALAGGDSTTARTDFETALQHEPAAADPYDGAELRLGLATTLSPAQPERARALIVEAEALAQQAADPELQARIARWRDDHPPG